MMTVNCDDSQLDYYRPESEAGRGRSVVVRPGSQEGATSRL